MWVFTVDGFFSAVEHRDMPDRVMVRARTKYDIMRLGRALKLNKVQRTPKADYQYRLTCPKLVWAEYLMERAVEIDYPNFKAAMEKRTSYARMEQLHDVWAVMAGFLRWES